MARSVPPLTLEELVEVSRIVDRATVRRVVLERRHGKSWGVIGKKLGVTPSAAWQRFERAARSTEDP